MKKPKELNSEINDLEPKSTIILMKIEFNDSKDYNEQKWCIKKRKLLILLLSIIITHHKRFKSFSSEKWLNSAFNFRLLVHVSWYENKSYIFFQIQSKPYRKQRLWHLKFERKKNKVNALFEHYENSVKW